MYTFLLKHCPSKVMSVDK